MYTFFLTFQQRKALHLSESSHRDQMRDPTLQPSTSPQNYSHQKTNKLHFNGNHPILNNKTSKQTNTEFRVRLNKIDDKNVDGCGTQKTEDLERNPREPQRGSWKVRRGPGGVKRKRNGGKTAGNERLFLTRQKVAWLRLLPRGSARDKGDSSTWCVGFHARDDLDLALSG